MRIGIEGQRLFRKKKAGMDIVALELIRNLQKLDQQNEYFIFVKPDEDRDCLQETANFNIVEVQGGNYLTWEQMALPHAVKAHRIDLLHCTSNTAPYFAGVPVVLTLHDIIFLEDLGLKEKGTRYQQLGKIYRKHLVPAIVKKCKKIITVSKQEKGRILKHFKLNEEKVEVVYNGVGQEFRQILDSSELQRVKDTFDLPDRFVFFLGNKDPKKNMPGAIEAFGQYAEGKPDARMVLTAITEPVLHEILVSLHRESLVEKILLPGFVPFSDLPAFYNLATVYIYPSFREGFGLPILEAFGCGTPVITADTSSMPEIGGDAAMLVDPHRPEEIAAAISLLMEDASLRQTRIEAGFDRVADFSWMQMAQQVLRIYKELAH